MAKATPAPVVVRYLWGALPRSGEWYEITLYRDNSIRIVRNWCVLDPRKEMPTLVESDAHNHRFLIAMLEPGAVRDEKYT